MDAQEQRTSVLSAVRQPDQAMKDDIKALKTAYENLLAYTSKLERELSELRRERTVRRGRYGWDLFRIGDSKVVLGATAGQARSSFGEWRKRGDRGHFKFAFRQEGKSVIITRIK